MRAVLEAMKEPEALVDSLKVLELDVALEVDGESTPAIGAAYSSSSSLMAGEKMKVSICTKSAMPRRMPGPCCNCPLTSMSHLCVDVHAVRIPTRSRICRIDVLDGSQGLDNEKSSVT